MFLLHGWAAESWKAERSLVPTLEFFDAKMQEKVLRVAAGTALIGRDEVSQFLDLEAIGFSGCGKITENSGLQ